MRHPRLILSLLSILTICGCATKSDDSDGFVGTVREAHRCFKGKVGSLAGNGQVTAVNAECLGFGQGPAGSGRYWVEFDLTPSGPEEQRGQFKVLFIFPRQSTGQTIITNGAQPDVEAWLVRSDKSDLNIMLGAMDHGGKSFNGAGEQMTGRVVIRWHDDDDFVIGADLVLPKDHSTWVRGEFVGTTNTRINPILWEWPALLLFRGSEHD